MSTKTRQHFSVWSAVVSLALVFCEEGWISASSLRQVVKVAIWLRHLNFERPAELSEFTLKCFCHYFKSCV